MIEYKVETFMSKDVFGTSYNDTLEYHLNQRAKRGWKLISVVRSDIQSPEPWLKPMEAYRTIWSLEDADQEELG